LSALSTVTPPLSRELMLTRLETDDWGDTYEGTLAEYHGQDYWQDQQLHEHEHIEQDPELQYQDSNEEGHGYEEEMVEHEHRKSNIKMA
jgi:hypothetical protein